MKKILLLFSSTFMFFVLNAQTTDTCYTTILTGYSDFCIKTTNDELPKKIEIFFSSEFKEKLDAIIGNEKVFSGLLKQDKSSGVSDTTILYEFGDINRNPLVELKFLGSNKNLKFILDDRYKCLIIFFDDNKWVLNYYRAIPEME